MSSTRACTPTRGQCRSEASASRLGLETLRSFDIGREVTSPGKAQLGGSDTEALHIDPHRRQLAEGRPPILTCQVTELDLLSTQLDGCVTPRFRPRRPRQEILRPPRQLRGSFLPGWCLVLSEHQTRGERIVGCRCPRYQSSIEPR